MMVIGAITDWWHVALLAGPMVVVVALLCRLLPCRPATRHLMWLTVLAFMLCVPLLPAAPSAGEFQSRTELVRSAVRRISGLVEPCLSMLQTTWRCSSDGSEVATPIALEASTAPIAAASEVAAPSAASPVGPARRPVFETARSEAQKQLVAERPRRVSRNSKDAIKTPLTDAIRILGLNDRRAEASAGQVEGYERPRLKPSRHASAALRPREPRGVQIDFDVPEPQPDEPVRVVAPLALPTPPEAARASVTPLRFEEASLAGVTEADAADRYAAGPDVGGVRGAPWPGDARTGLELTMPSETDVAALLHRTPSRLEAWRSFGLLLWQAIRELPPIPLAVWWGGASVVLVTSLARAARTRLLVERAVAAPAEVESLVADVAEQMKLRRAPQALMTARRISPMVWCGRQPRLVLPAELWDELDHSGRRVVISHELAHLKRRDHWVCWFDLAAACAYWWHPVVWWVRSKLHEEADLACDAWVTAMMPTDRTIYAKTLLRTKVFASSTTSAIPTMELGMSRTRTKKFARRLTMVMTHKKTPNRTLAGLAMASVVAAAGWLATPTMATSTPGESAETAPTARLIEAIAALAVDEEANPAPPSRPLPAMAPPAPEMPDVAEVPDLPEVPVPTAVPAVAAAPAVPTVDVSGLADAIAMATAGAGDDDVEERLDALEDRLDRLMDLLEDRLFEREHEWEDEEAWDDDWDEEEEWVEHGREPVEGELIVLPYYMPQGKLAALTELMIREDVPVLVSPHDDFIEVHGTPDQHHVFAMFVKMIAPDARVPEEFLHVREYPARGADMPERSRREIEKHEREAVMFEQRMVELDNHASTLREEHEIILMQAEEILSHAEDMHLRAEKIEDEAAEIEEQVEELEEVVRSMRGDVRQAAMNLLNELLGRHEAMLHEAEEHARMAGQMEREADQLERRAEMIERKLEAIYAEMEELEERFDRMSAAYEDQAIELMLVKEAVAGCEATCSAAQKAACTTTATSACSVRIGGTTCESSCTSEEKSCETKTESKGSTVKVFDNSDWVEVAEVEDAA
jgi:beta-lactamase regulating signal transducer with metallopeptidase domain/chaperonin cofactor prefoldin